MMDTFDYRYKVEIIKVSNDDGGGYLAVVPSLRGCMSDGETVEDALTNVSDAIKCWIETAEELGREIPKPDEYKSDDDFSGKLLLRVPKYIHKMITERALKENCSINQLIQSYISMGLGYEIGKNEISINLEYKQDTMQKSINDALLSIWQPIIENNMSKKRDSQIEGLVINKRIGRDL